MPGRPHGFRQSHRAWKICAWAPTCGATRPDIAKDLDYVFGIFPRLKEREKQTAGTLTGGEQQMLAIGRALMSKPKCLMLDEPSLGIAPLLVKTIFEKIVEINRELGLTILLVEQNANLALEDLALRLRAGDRADHSRKTNPPPCAKTPKSAPPTSAVETSPVLRRYSSDPATDAALLSGGSFFYSFRREGSGPPGAHRRASAYG